jgi:hypothetical protein
MNHKPTKGTGPEEEQLLSQPASGTLEGAIVLRPGEASRERERDVTINIAMPRALHRRMSVTCSALEISLKEALIRAARAWTQEQSLAVMAILDASQDRYSDP